MKPSLIIHPGFSKCATTSLQRLFMLEHHALATELGVKFLGREFLPNNGYPEVSKLMYQYESCVNDVQRADYAFGKYFISNEALAGTPQFLEVLTDKFTIDKVVFTTRFTPLQAISNFRYSGWLYRSFEQFLIDQHAGIFQSVKRFERKIEKFSDLGLTVNLCPIEATGIDLYDRFCMACFGTVPDILHKEPFSIKHRSNESIDFAFSDALNKELSTMNNKTFSSTLKQSLVKGAQRYILPDHIKGFAPDSLESLKLTDFDFDLEQYQKLMEKYDVTGETVTSSINSATENTKKLLSMPIATTGIMQELNSHAKIFLGTVLN
jgi:hypothetical protein